jgi:RimJ/RimL family protein N-acetyltransferase
VLKTDRLRLRPVTLDDIDSFLPVFDDPDVMRYIGDGKPRTIEKVRATLEISLAVQDRGLGLFAVESFETGEVLGDCGLIPIQRSGRTERGPEIELGYRLAKHAWGKG